jgi:hypothetical protein
MTHTIPHKGMQLHCPSEPTWPTFMVSSVHTTDLPSIAGRTIPAFVAGEFSDEPGKFATINLASIRPGHWEDSGV